MVRLPVSFAARAVLRLIFFSRVRERGSLGRKENDEVKEKSANACVVHCAHLREMCSSAALLYYRKLTDDDCVCADASASNAE